MSQVLHGSAETTACSTGNSVRDTIVRRWMARRGFWRRSLAVRSSWWQLDRYTFKSLLDIPFGEDPAHRTDLKATDWPGRS
jgi:hypothetical protein